MLSENEGIRIRLAYVRKFLAGVADDAYVRRVWVEGLGKEVWCFTEFVCGLYDDMSLAALIPEAVRAGLLKTNAAVALQEFSDKLEQLLPLVEGMSDLEVLDHPGWPGVSTAARTVLPLLPKDRPPPRSPAG